ncbi:hypothetical protein HKH49_002688, partial [Enterococcus faecalis]|nr:hypothetical protein [Enterococcus faecalis]
MKKIVTGMVIFGQLLIPATSYSEEIESDSKIVKSTIETKGNEEEIKKNKEETKEETKE